ncbi:MULTISPECIES: hypothetical protein [Actinomadura]|jgi:hypothetical protein|uniref:hypothetical protein n=1 Tax=Actinomadura TaxID=1988 RepID=UPI001652A4A6|nr:MULTISPECIES: hypothetical protein [Actinomadura]
MVTREGMIGLVVVALLATFCVRWAAVRLRLPMPTRSAVLIVFVLVAMTMFGNHMR